MEGWKLCRRGLFFWLLHRAKQASARLRVGLVIAMVMSAGAGCTGDSDKPEGNGEQPSPRAVRMEAAETGTIARTVDYVGTVRPVRQTEVNARIGATVAKLHAREGDRVEAGDPLVEMTSEELDARLRRLRAGVERARLDYEYQCGVSDAERSLADEGMVAELNAEASETSCGVARQTLIAERAALAEGQEQRRYLREEAPLSGVVLNRMVEVGEHVTPGRPMATVGSRQLDVRVMVTEGDVARGIEVGQKVQLGGPTGELSSRVTRVAPIAEGPGRTIEVRLELSEQKQKLKRTGMSIDVAFVLDESEDTVIVPADAVVETAQGPVVFVVSEGHLEKTQVTTGVRTAGRVEIVEPLEAGEPVATSRPQRLRDGEPVVAFQPGGAER